MSSEQETRACTQCGGGNPISSLDPYCSRCREDDRLRLAAESQALRDDVERLEKLLANVTRPREEEARGEPLYYIQDSRDYVGLDLSLWRPEGKGYTCDLDEAGLFTLAETRTGRPTDVAVPRAAAQAASMRVVCDDRLRRVLAEAKKKSGDSS